MRNDVWLGTCRHGTGLAYVSAHGPQEAPHVMCGLHWSVIETYGPQST